MEVRRYIAIWLGILLIGLIALPSAAAADEDPGRATLQERYAAKDGRVFFHGSGTVLIRDDFYHSAGYGIDIGYFFSETIGAELRMFNLHSRLGHAGDKLREEHNFVPDLRAPRAMALAGTRISWGYGKVLTLGRFVVHFDPQLTLHAGFTVAERRFVPTATTGIGFLTHWRRGVQVKLDLQASVHLENRTRGVIPAVGFLPVLSIGWSPGSGGPP